MVLKKEIALQIKDALNKNPQGLSITEIVRLVDINRNTAGRYLENLLFSGLVEMRRLGMAKIYVLSQRVPLSAVLSISSELVVQLDSSLRIIYANEPFLRLVGADNKTLFGKNIEYTPVAIVFDDLFPEFLKNIRAGLTGKEWSGEIALSTQDIIVFCRIAPTVFEDGRKGVSVFFEDITGRKQAEDALRESEERYHQLVNISPDAIIIHRQGKIIFTNPAFLKLTGALHYDEIIDKNILDFIHPDFREGVRKNIEKDLMGTLTPPMELPMLRIDGTQVFVEGRGVKTEIDGIPAIQVAIRDVTERRLAEEALRESEERYRHLYERAPFGIGIGSLDGRILTLNRAMEIITGFSAEDFKALNIADLFVNPADQAELVKTLKTSGSMVDYPAILKRKDGTRYNASLTIGIVNIAGKNVIQTLMQDVTARKRAEDALRESEEKYRNVVDRANDAICIIQDGITKMCNPRMADYWGGSVDEVLGRPFTDFIHPDVLSDVIDRYNRRISGETFPSIYETILKRKDGSRSYGEVNAGIISYKGKPADLVIIRDNNERKKIERTLRESEEKYRILVDRANDGIVIIQDGIVKMCNPRLPEYWGGSVDEIPGRPFTDFIHPDALSDVADRYNRRISGETLPSIYETILKRKDGGRFYAELNAGIISYEGKPADLVIVRDINNRKSAEDALRRSEATASALMNAWTDSVLLMDTRGKILALNKTAAARLGRRADELIGVLAEDLIPAEIAQRRMSFIAQATEKREVVRFEDERDGRWYETAVYPIMNGTGEVIKIAVISRDITDRKHTGR